MPAGAQGYNSLSESQRATFEAIVHALYAEGIFAILEEVTAFWGADPQSSDGEDQFRISVTLAPHAVDFLRAHRDYKRSAFGHGHVKRPNGDVEGIFAADSVRQRGERPTLQVSWLEDDFRTGEIDIDYRDGGEGHSEAANSDIRASVGDETHFLRHFRRYRTPPEINPWWRTP